MAKEKIEFNIEHLTQEIREIQEIHEIHEIKTMDIEKTIKADLLLLQIQFQEMEEDMHHLMLHQEVMSMHLEEREKKQWIQDMQVFMTLDM